MKLEELILKVEEWAEARNLIKGATVEKQWLKLDEEKGELAAGIARGDKEKTVDGLGDTLVVLIILAKQLGITFDEALGVAYEEIKDRKGKMINGIFVKEADLKAE